MPRKALYTDPASRSPGRRCSRCFCSGRCTCDQYIGQSEGKVQAEAPTWIK